jgi:hypothetical protein
MAKRGRPSKLDRDLHARFVEAVAKGHYRDTVARLCGLAPETVSRWMARGKDAVHEGRDTPYAAFYEDVKAAEAAFAFRAEEAFLGAVTGYQETTETVQSGPAGRTVTVQRRTRRQLNAIKHYLARKFPNDWGGIPVEPLGREEPLVDPRDDDPEEMERLRGILKSHKERASRPDPASDAIKRAFDKIDADLAAERGEG